MDFEKMLIERLKKVRGQIWYLEGTGRNASSWREYEARIIGELLDRARRLVNFAVLKDGRVADACNAHAQWIRLSIELA